MGKAKTSRLVGKTLSTALLVLAVASVGCQPIGFSNRDDESNKLNLPLPPEPEIKVDSQEISEVNSGGVLLADVGDNLVLTGSLGAPVTGVVKDDEVHVESGYLSILFNWLQ